MKLSIKMSFKALLLIILISYYPANSYEITSDSIFKHVSVLADDSLEGRQVGEIGEYKAGLYIGNLFKSVGLLPMGTDGFFQPYDFIKSIDLGEKNYLLVNGNELTINEEFRPMKQSGSMKFDFTEIVNVDYGIKTGNDSNSYNDYDCVNVEGKAVLIKRYAPSSEDNPHIDFEKYSSLSSKISTAIDHKATGVIFITPTDHDDTMRTISPTHIYPKEIPIIYLRRKALEKLELDLNNPALKSLSGEIELVRTRDTAQNIIGFLDNNNDTTIIIGAHYDHLGWGGPSSLYTGTEKQIHNGADDNASGVSAMLELARHYSKTEDRLNYSILFLALSGEEAGLLGANNFAKNMTVDSSKVRMMINMDMIGRLKDQENGLALLGTGTCEEFKAYFDSLNYDEIKLSLKESGTGPSDHTIFYNRGIPVLHLFTGAHNDYHKPSDDADKIDSDGILKVTKFVKQLVDHFDNLGGQLTFSKTKDPDSGKRRAQYSVTLGIMPDYVVEVKGLQVDGVVDDRPGQRAGIVEGDIIIKMGEITINDIYDYMNALGKFRKGDTTSVIVLRNQEEVELNVIFE
jgi:hypothetical protein